MDVSAEIRTRSPLKVCQELGQLAQYHYDVQHLSAKELPFELRLTQTYIDTGTLGVHDDLLQNLQISHNCR
jgi:hypothetical protein